jgi:hypothetical protein
MADSFQHIRAMSKIQQDLEYVHVSMEYCLWKNKKVRRSMSIAYGKNSSIKNQMKAIRAPLLFSKQVAKIQSTHLIEP